MEPGDQGGGDEGQLRARLAGELAYVVSSIRLVADGLRRIEAAPDAASHKDQLRAGLAALDEARAAAERVQVALAGTAPLRAPELPGASPAPPPTSARDVAILPPSSSRRPRSGHVLVVDDEPLVGRLVERALMRDHHVTVVTSGRAGLERIIAGERFDLILCDLMMPEMTGMDLHERLATVAADQADRMVFLTGGAFTRRARDFLRDRAFLEKPFDLRALEALVKDRLR